MKLEVGMYVRKKNGRIGKIIEVREIYNNHFEYLLDIKNSNFDVRCEEKHIYKTSHNIIDLIEVGDIVINKLGEIIRPSSSNIAELKDLWEISENHIKSIVTKEMFANAEYKVETN